MNKENCKQTVITQIIADMIDLPLDARERLKLTLAFRLSSYDIVARESLPAVSTYDNENVMQQFATAKLAENRETSSVKSYLYLIRTFFDRTHILWSDVTGEDVASYLAIRKIKDHASASYLASIQKALCVFYGWLFQHKYLAVDLREDIPRARVTQKQKKRLTDDEVEACRNVAKDGFERALLELMLSTGLRIGEIRNLEIGCLDFEKREIRVYGEKGNQWRILFMSPQCKLHLSKYVAGRHDGYVFPGKGNRPKCETTIERAATSIASRAHCHVRATVHVYRKTFASILYRKTENVLLVSKLLGHVKTDTTIKYYLVDDMDEMKHAFLKSV